MKPSPVYLDNNATTQMSGEARAAMEQFLGASYANPSSPYAFARPASRAVAKAREQVAALIGCAPSRVVFTSGGTESNNFALHAALTAQPERRHLVVSAVEHASVLAPARAWARRGVRVSEIPVHEDGALDLDALRTMVTSATALVSVMAANNESGVCYPLETVRAIAHGAGALFHTDAVQAVGKIDLATHARDYISLCAHKIHGPKGAGALVIPGDASLEPLLAGGEQEFGLRAGTENVAALAGFGVAAEQARCLREGMAARLLEEREKLEQSILRRLPGTHIVGAGQPRLPTTTLLLMEGVSTEALLAHLDLEGFCCSSGSACATGAHEASHVLRAQGLLGRGAALRISTSRFTQPGELESLVDALVHGVNQLRSVKQF
jgi:cysteine desulfurase